jgi:hypothetical protein
MVVATRSDGGSFFDLRVPMRRLQAFGGEVVETRRLELLTLSLQRRCSAN